MPPQGQACRPLSKEASQRIWLSLCLLYRNAISQKYFSHITLTCPDIMRLILVGLVWVSGPCFTLCGNMVVTGARLLVGTISWALMATGIHSANAAVALIVLGSFSTACSDVVVDSIVVERSRGEAQVPLRISHHPSGFKL